MTVRVYRSTDPGAPAHPGATLGSMAAMIRAFAVTGYGNISISSLVVTSGVGVATISGGNTMGVGTRILVAGATPSECNGDWQITAADATTVTLAMTGVSDATATGTITASIPGAGWEEPFTEAGNLAVFRALTGARQFYKIDDNQADADVAAIYAYESMSDVATGTWQWVSSSDAYRYIGKRQTGVDTYSTVWLAVADEKTCYFFLNTQFGLVPMGFGERQSYRDEDPFCSFVAGHSLATGLPVGNSNAVSMTQVSACNIITTGIYLHRGLKWEGRGQASVCEINGILNNCPGGAQFPAADAYSGLSYAVLPWEHGSGDAVALPGGRLRGLYHPVCNRPKTHMESFAHDGKTMLAVNYGWSATAGYYGQMWIDITGSWA